ncbi:MULTISPECIES: sulfatase family protein [Olivibacter]|jgi:arylsulfatase A-like enzyme|uniref:Sulfatase n=2 Tax=Olivibacter TaxID=376469 RepID=A0ABV6HMF9_9SPHI|nr:MULTISPECIES: sulfatase [Olivibacter]MDM8173041.1 sulfatase [Olivibacter sp. 47]QEL02828.1 sulfatase [Olivibacter sp. LS-1]
MVKKISICLLAFGIALASCNQNTKKSEGKPQKPNIIFIFSDDHAYQAIGAYGSKYARTPNIDRIAKEGAIFNNFLVTNSICGPSRANLLTGKYSHENGYLGNEGKFNVEQQLFSRLLKQADYQTAWIGKWHLGTLPGDAFDYWNILPGQGHYYNPDFINQANDTTRIEGYVTNIITDLATNWLDSRDTDKPFFLVVGEKATHREWLPDLEDLGAYDDVNFPLPETFYDAYAGRKAAADQDMTIEKTMRLKQDLKVNLDYGVSKNGVYNRFTDAQKERFSTYYNKISEEFDSKKLSGKALTEWKYQRYIRDYLSTANALDRNIGKLLAYLDEKGLAENTIVIYGSDQGFYLGEHGWFDKRFIYQESLKTPFLIRYPGVVNPGTKIDQHVLNIDWAPTLLEIAGVTVPKDIQGQSFLPVLQANGRDVRTREASYYHYYEFPEPHHVSPHFGVTTERYKLVRFYKGQNAWELYDLQKDPQELHNVYEDEAYQTTIEELKDKLKKLIDEYRDKEAATVFSQQI